MMRYDMVLFDLDGTLTDPGEGITNSVRYALARWGIEEDDRAKLDRFIGPPLMDSFRDFYGFSQEDCRKALYVYREYYADRGIYENEVYDGIQALLKKLKASGSKVILATSKPEEYARQILEHFGMAEAFDLVAGADMAETRCRKTDIIEYALESYPHWQEKRIVMVGDRHYDVQGAAAFGIPAIGVLYGYGGRQELEQAGAFALAENVAELEKLLIE